MVKVGEVGSMLQKQLGSIYKIKSDDFSSYSELLMIFFFFFLLFHFL